jgi:chromosome segregation ATPase
MRRMSSWLAGSIGGAVVAGGIWVGGRAVWLAARDPVDFAAHRREVLQKLGAEETRLQASLEEINRRRAGLVAELGTLQERARAADRALAALRADASWWRDAWDKLFGDADQVRTKEERIARLEATKTEAGAREPVLRSALTRVTWERDGAEIALSRVERELAAVERDGSPARHYLALAWRQSRWYLAAALAGWLLVVGWTRGRIRAPDPQ